MINPISCLCWTKLLTPWICEVSETGSGKRGQLAGVSLVCYQNRNPLFYIGCADRNGT